MFSSRLKMSETGEDTVDGTVGKKEELVEDGDAKDVKGKEIKEEKEMTEEKGVEEVKGKEEKSKNGQVENGNAGAPEPGIVLSKPD